MKVRVWVPAKFYVPYVIDVDEISEEAIKEKLKDIDPSEWERDPNFYEVYGNEFKDFVEEVDHELIELLDEPEIVKWKVVKHKEEIDHIRKVSYDIKIIEGLAKFCGVEYEFEHTIRWDSDGTTRSRTYVWGPNRIVARHIEKYISDRADEIFREG